MNQFDKTFLALVLVTGGWLIPERGGYWRGADGTRLSINNVQARGRTHVARLRKSGHLVEVDSTKRHLGLHPDWMSPNRMVYAATELARQVVLADDMFQETMKEVIRGVEVYEDHLSAAAVAAGADTKSAN